MTAGVNLLATRLAPGSHDCMCGNQLATSRLTLCEDDWVVLEVVKQLEDAGVVEGGLVLRLEVKHHTAHVGVAPGCAERDVQHPPGLQVGQVVLREPAMRRVPRVGGSRRDDWEDCDACR